MYTEAYVMLGVISMVNGNYVYYEDLTKYCKPVQCNPGQEIHPCQIQFTEDTCANCSNGFVQPDFLISSGDLRRSSCFKPIGHCLANDIKYSRTKSQAFCDSLQGCKCDTTKCYAGDPCLCKKHEPCSQNQFLHDNGTCMSCPKGTKRDNIGCGPCTLIISYKRNTDLTTKSTTEITTKKEDVRKPYAVQDNPPDSKDNKVLIICIAVLGAVVVILLLIILRVCTQRPDLVHWVCWTNGPRHLPRNDVENNIPEQELLVINNPEKPQNGKLDTKINNGPNLRTNPVDEKNAEVYRNNSNTEPCERCSVSSSGFVDASTPLDDTHHSWPENDEVFESDIDKNKLNETRSSTGSINSLKPSKIPEVEKHDEEQKPLLTYDESNKYRLSECNSPVTTESQPAFSSLADHAVHCNFLKNNLHTDLASGSYISMDYSGKGSSRCETEELPSTIETIPFHLTGYTTGDVTSQCSKNSSIDTKAKHCGPSSFTSNDGDSGIHMT